MAGFNRTIDPQTRDYVSDGDGGTKKSRTAETPIYYQVKTQLGQWWGDPAAGSRFFELERSKSSLRTPVVIRDIFSQCFAPLVADGRITEPELESERRGDRIDTQIESIDLSTGETLDLVNLLTFLG